RAAKVWRIPLAGRCVAEFARIPNLRGESILSQRRDSGAAPLARRLQVGQASRQANQLSHDALRPQPARFEEIDGAIIAGMILALVQMDTGRQKIGETANELGGIGPPSDHHEQTMNFAPGGGPPAVKHLAGSVHVAE